MTAAVNDKRE